MAGRDPDAQRRRPDREPQRRAQVDGLAINAGVHWCWGVYLEKWRAPSSPGKLRAVIWQVENHDSAGQC